MEDTPDSVGRANDLPLSWGLSAAFLKKAVWLVLLASLVILFYVYYSFPDHPLCIVALTAQLLASAVSLLLLSRQKVRAALTLLLWSTWMTVSFVLAFFGGVRSTLVVTYPLLIMLCGWLLGILQSIVMTSLVILATLALVLADQTNAISNSPVSTAAMYGLIQITCIISSAFLIIFLVRMHNLRLREVEKLSTDLALRTAEAQAIAADLNTAQTVGRIGSWAYDFSTGKVDMSAEAYRIFDLPENIKSIRRHYLKRVHPEDFPGLKKAWREAINGRVLLNEHRIVIGNTTRWICHRAKVEFDSNGKPLRCVGTTQDITEPKRAEEALRIAATAFESQEGIVVTDAHEVILRVNQAFTRITGYSIDDVSGKTPRLLGSGRHDQAFYSAMWQAIIAHGSWEGEIWDRRKSGEVYPEWLTITAVKDAQGKITHYVGIMADITQRKAAEDEIKHLAFYDPLTRLPNRRLLLDRLQQAMASSARSGRQGALMFLDLDNFKLLNDSLGHDKGDQMLQQAAQRLSACIREGDTVARFGGDEFVIMLPDLSTIMYESTRQAETVGQKILASLSQPYTLGQHTYISTASIGITIFADHQSSSRELLNQADLAMYAAKAAGRNMISFYSSGMSHPHANSEEESG